MATKPTKSTTKPAVEAPLFKIHTGVAAPERTGKGVISATLQSLTPGTDEHIIVTAGQRNGVNQAARSAGFKVITAIIRDANKKPTGQYRVWRKS